MSENFSLDLLAHDPRRIGELTTDELAAVMALGSSLQMTLASELVMRQSLSKAEPKRELEATGDPYLTVDDVRKLLKLPSAKSVYRLVKNGTLRRLRVGRRFRFRAADLHELASRAPENVLDFPVSVTHSRARGPKTGKSEGGEKPGDEKNSPQNDRRRAPRDSAPARLDAKADGRVHGDDSVKHRKVRARRAKNASPRGRFRPTGLEV